MAWELAAAAHPHLSRVEADRIYIAIGVGDVFEAIDALLTAIARDRIPLGHDLVGTIASWMDCYRGQDAETRLRQLLAEIKQVPPQQMSAFEERFRAMLVVFTNTDIGYQGSDTSALLATAVSSIITPDQRLPARRALG